MGVLFTGYEIYHDEVTTSYRGCYGRVTNDSTGRDAHAENVGYIGVVWARVPSVVGLGVVR